jgi:ribosomal protein S18 acetylase RimI-like enzyme
VKFGDVTSKNVEQLRILNYMNLPVIYSEDFYNRLTSYIRYSKLAYVKDVLVGAISCKEDTLDNGEKVAYIMTITVLKPYRRYGIGSQLLKKSVEDFCKSKEFKKMTLHVQKGNDSAMEFYKKHGFIVKEELKDYYTDLTPADCFVLIKDLEE